MKVPIQLMVFLYTSTIQSLKIVSKRGSGKREAFSSTLEYIIACTFQI